MLGNAEPGWGDDVVMGDLVDAFGDDLLEISGASGKKVRCKWRNIGAK